MEVLLDPDSFMRVHRNAIVNLDRVREFQIPSAGNMFAVLWSGKQLPLSRGYQGDLRAFLCRSLGVPCRVTATSGGEAQDESRLLPRASDESTAVGHSAFLH
jgi:hypothetical protein